jgi:hypothetical protein
MRSSVTDMAAGLFALLIAAVFFSQSGDLEGVGLLYPRLLIGFIALCGIYLVGLGLFKRRPGRDRIASDEPVAVRRVGMIAALSLAYCLLIPVFGFYPASALFLFGAAMILNDAGVGPLKAALSACILTVVMCLAVWAGFALLLHVPTPEGLLF